MQKDWPALFNCHKSGIHGHPSCLWHALPPLFLRERMVSRRVRAYLPVVMYPILFPSNSVNQRVPSGLARKDEGQLLGVETENSVIVPSVVMRPSLLLWRSATQRLPSGPATRESGSL